MSDFPPASPHQPVQPRQPQESPFVTAGVRFVARPSGTAVEGRGTGAEGGVRRGLAGETLEEFGELASLVADPLVTDVFANGAGQLWFDRGRGLESQQVPQLDEPGLRELAVRLIARGGRHIDETSPCVDVRLHDGIRVHAVLPPISPRGTLLSIRLPRIDHLSLGDLDAAGMFDLVPLTTITGLIERRANILISGAGGSGKTTLLSAMLSSAPGTDRIVAIEDVAELRVAHPHFVSLEARQANLEGAGEVGLQRLVREALRMRPDRLVLGECRGAEIRELLAALNTGHDGGAGTLHANSLADVPARLEALGALADMSPTAVARQTVSAIDAVLHLRRDHGQRRLAEVGSFELEAHGRLRMVEHPPSDQQPGEGP
ncbi:MAG: TadA family conjugal transfer-associated ATPase [Homoserinimonas sp.]